MNSTRKIAVITGVIFIIATVASLVAAALTPVLTGTDYLTRFSAHTNQVAAERSSISSPLLQVPA